MKSFRPALATLEEIALLDIGYLCRYKFSKDSELHQFSHKHQLGSITYQGKHYFTLSPTQLDAVISDLCIFGSGPQVKLALISELTERNLLIGLTTSEMLTDITPPDVSDFDLEPAPKLPSQSNVNPPSTIKPASTTQETSTTTPITSKRKTVEEDKYDSDPYAAVYRNKMFALLRRLERVTKESIAINKTVSEAINDNSPPVVRVKPSDITTNNLSLLNHMYTRIAETELVLNMNEKKLDVLKEIYPEELKQTAESFEPDPNASSQGIFKSSVALYFKAQSVAFEPDPANQLPSKNKSKK